MVGASGHHLSSSTRNQTSIITITMTATSLQFGPEWMRNKQQAARSPPSMSLPGTSPPTSSSSGATPAASTYSSLLSSAAYETNRTSVPLQDGGGQQGQIGATAAAAAALNPFKYTKEEMLQVWRLGGGCGGLGLEVEQWEGVVKEMGGEPIGLRDMTEGERKVCVSFFSSALSGFFLFSYSVDAFFLY